MRVGIIAIGSRGDVQPHVALGKGLQQAGYEVCVLTHDAFEGLVRGEHLEFFAVDDVPHDWLFPQTAAVVHHGGAGTTGARLRAEVSTIIIPFMSDQPFWGDLVYKRGVRSRPIHQRRLSTEAITQAVSDQEMRDCAAMLGEKMHG